MNDYSSSLPSDLNFLEWLEGDRQDEYRRADWLKSDFHAEVWKIAFGRSKFEIDFHVTLEDASLLTASKNQVLLDCFKTWLCVQGHPDNTGGVFLSQTTVRACVSRVLRTIDYFLINAAHFKLGQYGLRAITSDDIKRFVVDLSSSKSTLNSIYRWNEYCAAFLRHVGSNLNAIDFQQAISEQPMIAIIDDDKFDRTLDLDDHELVRARAYLWVQNMYRCGEALFRFSASSTAIAKILYRDTLWGHTLRTDLEELSFHPIERYGRELPNAAVRGTPEDIMSKAALMYWRTSLRSMGLLQEIGLPIPISSLEAISSHGFLDSLTLKSDGRVKTLPHKVVLSSFRNAIEFTLEYGEDLFESYLTVAAKAISQNVTVHALTQSENIQNLVTEKIRCLGVNTWRLSAQQPTLITAENIKVQICKNNYYFQGLRNNHGLYELLGVLYGALQICIGTVMARRQSELLELIAGKCLDKTRRYLIFENAKSGFIGMRQREARPIPEVAARFIVMIETFQKKLVALGCLEKPTHLFATPHHIIPGLTQGGHAGFFNKTLDRFCDYFETSTNEHGERYYIRQHQLRRFFAMLFFWGRSFGGIETLSWFFGHTDARHIYHYISESTTGEILIAVKAQFAAQKIQSSSDEFHALSDLMEKHFGTRKFSVLDRVEVEEYIESLLADGVVEIEPHFFNTPDGTSYKVIVKITESIDDK